MTAANGIFAIFAILEILWILSLGKHGKEFMENMRFYADHLKSNFFLESHLFYPRNFASSFSCSVENLSTVNGTLTQSTTLFNCSNRRAGNKNDWTKVVTVTNGIFAFSAFLDFIKEESTKILLIFDGFDEYSRKTRVRVG